MPRTLNPIRRHREHCRQTRALMSEYIDGELDAGDRARVERHVRWCPTCRRMLANLIRTVRALGRLGEHAEPGESV
ncbi:MAG: anti-sigma factor family protein [Solirubrobacteraceae bacterium]